jgi:hypothetical protein
VLLGGFAAFTLLIAVIGLFGGLSYSVTQRTHEIGVRTAVGATPRDIMSLVMKQGTLMTLAGLTIGFGLAADEVVVVDTALGGLYLENRLHSTEPRFLTGHAASATRYSSKSGTDFSSHHVIIRRVARYGN